MSRKLVLVFAALVVAIPTTAWATHTFTDVPDGRYFTEPVDWAYTNGITTGRNDDIFDPGAAVTRGESVTFLKRYHDNIAANLDTDTLGALTCTDGQVAKRSAGTWTCGTDTDTNTDTLGSLSCGPTQVAIDDSGWRCADPVLQRSYVNSSTSQLGTPGFAGGDSSITLRKDGRPLISHYDANNGDLELYVCGDPACNSGTNRTLVTTGVVGRYSSVAIGADGNPVISHWDITNGDLMLFACADAACTAGANRTLVSTGTTGMFTSLAIGSGGNPVISYYDKTNGDLDFYACTDATCSTPGTNSTLVSTDDVGSTTSMALGTTGNPVISHYNLTSGDLELYTCDNPTCTAGTNHTLATTGDVGAYSSVAIGTDGNPVIAFYDLTSLDLEFYACANPNCTSGTTHTLVSSGSVGVFPATAIGTDGNPVVVHRDVVSGDLQLYSCDDPACATGTNDTVRLVSDAGWYNPGARPALTIGAAGDPVVAFDPGSRDLEIVLPHFAITGIAFQ